MFLRIVGLKWYESTVSLVVNIDVFFLLSSAPLFMHIQEVLIYLQL